MADSTGTSEDTPVDDYAVGVEDGEISAVAIVDMLPTFDGVTTEGDLISEINSWLAEQQSVVAPDVYSAMQETVNPLTDAVNDGIVPPSQARYFFFWLAYNAGVTLIPAAGIYVFIQKYVVKWAQQNGWATMGPNPVQTPSAKAFIESANAANPLPGAANPAPVLPSPSVGQSTTVQAAKAITPVEVPASGLSPIAAQQVQAAIGVASVDVLKAMAAIVDAMLPNMAQGQVPEALSQQNTAINALEAQMQQVRNGQWPRGYNGLSEAFNGLAQAFHGAEQEINELAQQMATKADSGLEDAITAVKSEADATAAGLAVVVGTTVPVLEGELGTLTEGLSHVTDTVTNDLGPTVTQLEAQVAANTKKLALTDDECLEALCDAVQNVTDPIKEGGATSGLLKNLGNLLTRAVEIGALMALIEGLVTIADAKIAIAGVVSDTETITGWAEGAASVIESDFSLSGWG